MMRMLETEHDTFGNNIAGPQSYDSSPNTVASIKLIKLTLLASSKHGYFRKIAPMHPVLHWSRSAVRSVSVAFSSCRTWRVQRDAGAFSHSFRIAEIWRWMSSADTDVLLPGCAPQSSTVRKHGFLVEAHTLGASPWLFRLRSSLMCLIF